MKTILPILILLFNIEGSFASSKVSVFQQETTSATLKDNPEKKVQSLRVGEAWVELNAAIYQVKPGSKVELNLPSRTFSVVFDKKIVHKSGNRTWVGHLEKHPKYRVMITGKGSVFSGRIVTPDKVYAIRHQNNQTILIDQQLAGMTKAPFGEDYKVPPEPALEINNLPQQKNNLISAEAEPATTVIDVLILYSPGIASDFPDDALAVEIDRLTALTNQAYADSGITSILRVVGSQLVDYADSGANSMALDVLTNGTGAFSNTSVTRDNTGADLVIFLRKFTDQSNGCGLAWVFGEASVVNPTYFANNHAYGVVSLGSYQISEYSSVYCSDSTYPHEIGHLMGSNHDRNLNTNGAAYSYAIGHYSLGQFGTIMSYENPEVLYFSNPGLLACGNSEEACGVAVGLTAEADNRTAFNQTSPLISNFRSSVVSSTCNPESPVLIKPNDIVMAGLNSGDCTLVDLGLSVDDFSFADVYRTTLQKGGVLNIEQNSEEFDSFLILLDEESNEISSNDDRQEGDVNAQISQSLNTGDYFIVANSYSLESGAYELITSCLGCESSVYGDFGADTKADILLYSSGLERLFAFEMDGANILTSKGVANIPNWSVVDKSNDFNGDGKADILLRHNNSHALNIFLMNGNIVSSSKGVAKIPGWSISGIADFNGDNKADILLQNDSTGVIHMFLMNGTEIQDSQGIANVPDWTVAGTGDHNGDGKADILLYRPVSHNLHLFTMNGTSITATRGVANIGAWTVSDVSDYTGDSKADILLYHPGQDRLHLYTMDGSTIRLSTGADSLVGYTLEGHTDLDGDNKTDLLVRDSANKLHAWIKDGAITTDTGILSPVNGWSIADLADYDGDGDNDVLLQHDTNDTLHMLRTDGATILQSKPVGRPIGWRALD